MTLGNKFYLILILNLFFLEYLIADNKITASPLINIQEIKPSFEELEDENTNISSDQKLKEKKILSQLNRHKLY